MNYQNSTISYLAYLASLGIAELRKRHLAFFKGNEVHGIPWHHIQMLKMYGFISQQDMDYIVLNKKRGRT